jgi:iron-sulfur cluster repair protein YtfE (RIC family)
MLRDKSLIPLSHQHQHALGLCVRIERASPIGTADLAAWQVEAGELFRAEIEIHFAAEEQVLFPAARSFRELVSLVEKLQADHVWLRECFAQAETHSLSAEKLSALAQRLSAHIRREERQLFERLQELLRPGELATLGKHLETALKDSTQTCILPTEATKLRPGK